MNKCRGCEAFTKCTAQVYGDATCKYLRFSYGMDDKTEMTNADRIRAMSDEELADALQKFCIAMVDCSDCPLYDFSCPKNSIFNYWIEWLQQPAEIKKL